MLYVDLLASFKFVYPIDINALWGYFELGYQCNKLATASVLHIPSCTVAIAS